MIENKMKLKVKEQPRFLSLGQSSNHSLSHTNEPTQSTPSPTASPCKAEENINEKEKRGRNEGYFVGESPVKACDDEIRVG